jgi:competence ComEA-like helix-hairpin-helix protein
MITGIRSYLNATLAREQQLVILVFGLCLTGLLAWRADFIWPSPPLPIAIHHNYFIEIIGNTPRPGFQVFLSPPTIQEVWEAAGGQGAVPNARQPISGGTKITVGPERAVTLTRMSGSELLTLGLALDPNLASAADLEAIPGIGPVLAKRIVEFREEHGPFQLVEALLAVKGLGPGKLEKIRPYLEITRLGSDRENEED